MSLAYNYRHLYYFWVVAKEGGMSRAATRLGMAVQTVSAQVRELERALGCQLLQPAGRGVALTDAGQAALRHAEPIFQLGETLPQAVRDAGTAPAVRLAVGVADGLPKLVVHQLMQPVLHTANLRLLCHEQAFDDLLGNLAVHRLDLVLADRAAPANPALRLFSRSLGSSGVSWYAAPQLAARARALQHHALARLPVLLPTSQAAVRARIDHWFAQRGLQPAVVGEFEDSALLKTFGAGGMGLFPAPDLVQAQLAAQYGVERVAPLDGVEEHFFLINTERRVVHPLVRELLAARDGA